MRLVFAQHPPKPLFIPATFPSNHMKLPTALAELHLQLGLFVPSDPKLALDLAVNAQRGIFGEEALVVGSADYFVEGLGVEF